MPLTKGSSHKSFVKNLKTELEHGHPMKQSLAIAYAMKRKAKKMADGGSVKGVHKPHIESSAKEDKHWAGESTAGYMNSMSDLKPTQQKVKDEHHRVLGEMHSMKKPNLKGLADGGPVIDPTHRPYSATNSNIAQGIANMGKHAEGGEVKKEGEGDGLVDRIIKRMSEGGKVANDTLEDIDETPAQYDDLVLDDNLEPHFDGPGNEVGDEQEDEDRHDIVSRVMASRRKKDRMPNPA